MSTAKQIHVVARYSEMHMWDQSVHGYKPVVRSNENPIVYPLDFIERKSSAVDHFSRSVFFRGLDFSTSLSVLNTLQWNDPYNLHPADCTPPLGPLFACSIQVRGRLGWARSTLIFFFISMSHSLCFGKEKDLWAFMFFN